MKSLKEFLGQDKIKKALKVQINAAKARNEALGHILLCGPEGQGKKTLAKTIACEMGVDIKLTSGLNIDRAGDMARILTNLRKGDILYMDEIHRLPQATQDILGVAMRQFVINIVTGKGASTRNLRLSLPHFTVIGATTDVKLLKPGLLNKFEVVYPFEPYEQESLSALVQRFAEALSITIDDLGTHDIVKRAGGSVLEARKLLRRARDFAQVRSDGVVTKWVVEQAVGITQPHFLTGESRVKATSQIFLSYAREDEGKVENLYRRLTDTGFKPWMDKRDILPGENWRSSIQKAIQRSDFFLACLSANSVSKRGFLQKEIKYALDTWQEMLDSDIYLIPVRMENCKVPDSLRDFQWVNLFEENGWMRLVQAIRVGIERRAEEIKPTVNDGNEEDSEWMPVNELQQQILLVLHAAYKARPNYPGTRSDVLMAELGVTDEARYVVAIKSLIAKGYVESKGTQQHPYFMVKITPEGNELVEAVPPPKEPRGFVR